MYEMRRESKTARGRGRSERREGGREETKEKGENWTQKENNFRWKESERKKTSIVVYCKVSTIAQLFFYQKMWFLFILTSILVPRIAPINVTARMINQTAANISWIYPLDSNNPDDISLLGGMIKGFHVIVFAPDSSQLPNLHRNYQGTIGRDYWDIVSNLIPGTTYHAQVKAYTKKGDGKPSIAYIFTVPKEDSRK